MSRRSLRPAPGHGRPSGRGPAVLPGGSRLLVRATAALLAAAVVLGGSGTALADPPNPTDDQIQAAQAAKDAAAAEVDRIAGLVAVAEDRLEQVQVQAEAAGTAYLQAEEARQSAEDAAEKTARDLAAATDAVHDAQARLTDFSRNSYMNGSALTSEMALLDVEGPTELVRKAAMLDYVGDHQVDVLDGLEAAQAQQDRADAAARTAREEKAAAEAAAEAAKAQADAQLAAQKTAVADAGAQKKALDRQLQDAQVHLLELQGARDAHQAWVAQQAAVAAAAAKAEKAARAQAAADAKADSSDSGYVRPATGTTSSCFGSRWGLTHFGVDIAAPIGTPVYAATAGVVQRAGAATGFGLAVYIRGDDGAVTVYGHVNKYYVRAGERVDAGEQIAEVGNRGQSTGPHLHFEVHPSGAMYGGQIDPVPWLASRGITIRGC
jgi:murein DD-endopeptidase MepM/ murein hydrolase activator NlpD